jgi:hypothetical protein
MHNIPKFVFADIIACSVVAILLLSVVSVVTEEHTIILLFFALAGVFQSSAFCTICLPVPYILYIV